MRAYLAAPFFNPEQLAVVSRLELLLADLGLVVYSPRKDGVLLDMTPEERRASTARVFARNCEEILAAHLVVAVVDGRDTGVVWEMGFACAHKVPIVTYTDHDYGLNVMIKESVAAHCRGAEALADALRAFVDMPTLDRDAYLADNHRQFDPRTY